MRHYIAGSAGSEEWKQNFRLIRDAFITKLSAAAKMSGAKSFLACTPAGEPEGWIWNEQNVRCPHRQGTLEDACDFAARMIDQGMFFGFAVEKCQGRDAAIWLTTWEEPEIRPKWPEGAVVVTEELHEGVYPKSMEPD